MSEKITVEIEKEALDFLNQEINCLESLIDYAKEIDHIKLLSKLVAELRNFLKSIKQL